MAMARGTGLHQRLASRTPGLLPKVSARLRMRGWFPASSQPTCRRGVRMSQPDVGVPDPLSPANRILRSENLGRPGLGVPCWRPSACSESTALCRKMGVALAQSARCRADASGGWYRANAIGRSPARSTLDPRSYSWPAQA